MADQKGISRRSFLKRFGGAFLGILLLPALVYLYRIWKHRSLPVLPQASDPLPLIELNEAQWASSQFLGHDPHRAHAALWDKKGFIASQGGIPLSDPAIPIVIIGGGISGLVAAEALADLKPVVLEQAANFGGNSRGERWQDSAYSLGAAYIVQPEAGSDIEGLLKRIGLPTHPSPLEAESQVLIETPPPGRLLKGFWEGSSDPARKAEFKRIHQALIEIGKSAYPDLPPTPQSALSRAELDRLDRQNFLSWARKNWGPLHPHIEEYFQKYCWSAFCGGAEEISAAQALNFLAGDFSGTLAFAGGNAAIAQALFARLNSLLPENHFRPSCITVDLSIQAGGVRVIYLDEKNQLRSLTAKACVVAAPKFVAKRLLADEKRVPSSQLQAMAKIEYRAYCVANVLLKKPMRVSASDVFRLSTRAPKSAESSRGLGFTDLVFSGMSAETRVLTLYRGYPVADARASLLADSTFSPVREEFEKHLNQVLPALGIQASQVEGLRIARWGHALPLARTGMIASRTAETASQSIDGRIFFAQQDCWVNPAFEVAFHTGRAAAEGVRRWLEVPHA